MVKTHKICFELCPKLKFNLLMTTLLRVHHLHDSGKKSNTKKLITHHIYDTSQNTSYGQQHPKSKCFSLHNNEHTVQKTLAYKQKLSATDVLVPLLHLIQQMFHFLKISNAKFSHDVTKNLCFKCNIYQQCVFYKHTKWMKRVMWSHVSKAISHKLFKALLLKNALNSNKTIKTSLNAKGLILDDVTEKCNDFLENMKHASLRITLLLRNIGIELTTKLGNVW